MRTRKNNIEMYEIVAKRIGLDCEYIQTSTKKKSLLIKNKDKFFIIGTGAPGFYPSVKRFNSFLTTNKILTQQILQKFGYKVISTLSISPEDYSSLVALLEEVEKKTKQFPLLVKPNKGQDGQHITICEDIDQLAKVCEFFFTEQQGFLIQPIYTQNEYRILVVDNELVLMHSKSNPTVVGDGIASIKSLLAEVPESKKSQPVIDWQHKKRKTTPDSILKSGETFEYHITKIPSVDVYITDTFPPAVATWARTLAKTIGSPVVGIDVFIPSDITDTSSYTVIELNSNPAVYYLPWRCNDAETPYRIIEKVLTNYFKLS